MPIGTDEQKVITEATGKNIVSKLEDIKNAISGDSGDAAAQLKGIIDRSITSIDNKDVTSIGDYAFYEYTLLNSVSFPKVTSIGNSAFQNCTSLTSISFPETTSIGYGSFSSCSGLTSVSFPKVTSIGNNAFQNCTSLTSISFPEVTSINSSAFSGCTSLNSLTLGSSTRCSLVNINAFNNTPFASGGTGGTLYVPSDLITTYKYATNWKTILGYPNNSIQAIPT